MIFTKNIRDSFLKCICCGKTFDKVDNPEAEGLIQNNSNPSSHLNVISSDSKRASPVAIAAENSDEVEEEQVSLVFGSLRSGPRPKLSGHQYGEVS